MLRRGTLRSANQLSDAIVLELLGKQVDRYHSTAARLASYCVQVKTWCVTAIGAIAALAVNNNRPSLFGIGMAVLALFMLLDVQYLSLERRFRDAAHTLAMKADRPATIRAREEPLRADVRRAR